MTESDDALMLRVAREEIKRQAAEIERLQHWQRAVDDACTVSWVTVTDDARETVKALIARECQIALDPLVSSDAQALIDRGREEANKGGGMLQKQKSSKLREITKADVSRAERWLNEAPRELKRNEYHKVKMLCKQVIRVLRRKETESACNNTETRSLNAEIERLKARLEVSPEHPYDGIFCRDATIKLQDERIASLAKHEPVAWDVYESRIYGAPGEKNHRVLWVEHYKRDDGSTPDLDWLLNSARNGGLSGGKTIHVRPLVYGVKNED